MTSFALYFSACNRRDHPVPPALQPAREARCLDFAHLRERSIALAVVRPRRLRPSAALARALARAARLRSWWDRSVKAALADALRLPAADGIPPRASAAPRGHVTTHVRSRPPLRGLAACQGGERG